MSVLRERRLRTFLVFLLTSATFFTLVVVGSGIALFRLPQIMDENRATLIRKAEETADRVQFLLQTLEERVSIVDLARHGLSGAGADRLLERIRGDSFGAVYLTNADGIVVANSVNRAVRARTEELNGIDLHLNHLIKKVREVDGTVWSDKFLSVVSGKVTIAVAMPVEALGGVVVGELPLDGLLRISRFAETGEDLDFWIVDGRGEVVADTGSDTAVGTNLSHLPIVSTARRGGVHVSKMKYREQNYLVAASSSKSLGWRFISRARFGLDNPPRARGRAADSHRARRIADCRLPLCAPVGQEADGRPRSSH